MRRKSLQMLAAGSLLAAGVGQALAVNVGGLDIPLGAAFSAGQIYTSLPTAPGGQLAGYGKIDSFNSATISDLCGGCELTYVFDGYTLEKVDLTGSYFSGGSVRVYMGTGAEKDFSTLNPGSSPTDDLAEASNGTLWLTLKGHAIDAAGTTFIGTQTSTGTAPFRGGGEGWLDVDSSNPGAANAFFDSNSVTPPSGGGMTDFYIASTFNSVATPYPGTLQGSMSLNTAAVPEPETYALMLSALGLIGFVVHRRRRV